MKGGREEQKSGFLESSGTFDQLDDPNFKQFGERVISIRTLFLLQGH